MADVDNPKTHVEDQDLEGGSRTQPESPKNEGIDPLTEGDTMYPSEDTKTESEQLTRKQEKLAAAKAKAATPDKDYEKQAKTLQDQTNQTLGNENDARDEPLRDPNERTEPVKAEGKVQPQTKKPANTNKATEESGDEA